MSSSCPPSACEDIRRGVALTRFSVRDLDDEATWMLMGHTVRHPITGAIHTADEPDFQDYTIVDLFIRAGLPDSMGKLRLDKYLYSAVPLTTRTWLYHEDFRRQLTLDKDENAMIRAALMRKCIDAPTPSGRWSPLVTLAPLVVGVALSDDTLMLLLSLLAVLSASVGSEWANSVAWYQLVRPISLLPRLAFYAAVLLRIGGATGAASGLNSLGFVVVLATMGADVLLGDLRVFLTARLLASWEITHCLPRRLFVCKRHGAMSYEKRFGARGKIPEEVVGFSPWASDQALIADIQGVLVELRPMTDHAWELLYEQSNHDERIGVVGLDIFSDKFPTLRAVQAESARIGRPAIA